MNITWTRHVAVTDSPARVVVHRVGLVIILLLFKTETQQYVLVHFVFIGFFSFFVTTMKKQRPNQINQQCIFAITIARYNCYKHWSQNFSKVWNRCDKQIATVTWKNKNRQNPYVAIHTRKIFLLPTGFHTNDITGTNKFLLSKLTIKNLHWRRRGLLTMCIQLIVQMFKIGSYEILRKSLSKIKVRRTRMINICTRVLAASTVRYTRFGSGLGGNPTYESTITRNYQRFYVSRCKLENENFHFAPNTYTTQARTI